MSFSGGVFTINSTGQPVVTNTVISSTVFNALTADLATGLSTCVLKDGSQTATASVPFVLGIGVGTANAFAVSSAGTITATSTSTQTISGPVSIAGASAGQIVFPATQNASAGANTLDDYEESTWTGTLTGGTTSPTATVRYTKIGNFVFMNIEGDYTVTSNAVDKTITGMPAGIRPSVAVSTSTGVADNGSATVVPGVVSIATSGVITIGATLTATGNWTAANTATIRGFFFGYPIG